MTPAESKRKDRLVAMIRAHEERKKAAGELQRARERDGYAERDLTSAVTAAAEIIPEGRALLATYESCTYQIQHLAGKILIEVATVKDLK